MKKLHKKNVVYVLPQLYCFGEPIDQLFCLRNIYNEEQFNITIFSYPLQKLRVNRSVFSIITRGLNVIHTTDNELIWFSTDSEKSNIYPIEKDNTIYAVTRETDLRRIFFRKFYNRNHLNYFFSLTDLEKNQGKILRKKFGIPQEAPIITIHVRDDSWLEQLTQKERKNEARSAGIETYIPAIQFLISEGYYVVRLGHKGMKQLKSMPPQYIDVANHSEYTDFVDPYFISVSTFFICVDSGPVALSEGFNIPRLYTNALLYSGMRVHSGDLCIPKKYYSNKLKRFLTYEEILLGIDIHSDRIDEFDIQLKNNTSDEILFATKEMLCNIRSKNTQPYIKLETFKQLVAIQSRIRMIKGLNDPESLFLPLFNLVTPHEIRISQNYILSNPQLLGHNCINNQSSQLDETLESVEFGEKLSKEHPDKAYDFFLLYIQKNGKNDQIYNNLGVITYRQNKIDLSLFYFSLAIELNPSYSLCMNNIYSAFSNAPFLDYFIDVNSTSTEKNENLYNIEQIKDCNNLSWQNCLNIFSGDHYLKAKRKYENVSKIEKDHVQLINYYAKHQLCKNYSMHRPHRNLIVSSLSANSMNDFIKLISNSISNTKYYNVRCNNIEELPQLFSELRLKTISNTYENTNFDNDVIVALPKNLLHFNNEEIKKLVNQYGYKVVSIIPNPSLWLNECLENFDILSSYKNLNYLSSTQSVDLEIAATLWNSYVDLCLKLKDIVTIYTHEQINYKTNQLIKDLSDYLGVFSENGNNNIEWQSINGIKKDNRYDAILKKYCPARSDFHFEDNQFPELWDSERRIFCRSVPTIK